MNEDELKLLADIARALTQIVGQLVKLNLAIDAIVPEQETGKV